MSRLQVEAATVTFDGVPALSAVDLAVEAGEWVGVIGPNGAGKTTLLRTVVGTVRATGRVLVEGTDLTRLSRRARSRLVAFVPQRPTIPSELTVTEYVMLGRTPHLSYLAAEGRQDRSIVAEALLRMDLQDLSHRRLNSLSGGELQRAVLARAIAQQAEVLLLDEPIASLDLGHQQQVMELVEVLRRGGLAVVSTLHDLTMAARFCDRLVLMAGGGVVAEGSAESVITEASIRRHYGATVRVMDDGTGGLVVVPLRNGSPVPTLEEASR
jgi:iron complex transport system ATP-binding protein